MDKELWADIEGFENEYQVSNSGKVRKLKGKVKELNQGDSKGYKTVSFQRKTHLVHRLVCMAFNGPPSEDKNAVHHIDENKTNNTPENLMWVSVGENITLSRDIRVKKALESCPTEENQKRYSLEISILSHMGY